MQLYFLTAVGWSLDSSGNLQARDTAGNLLLKFVNGLLSAKHNFGTAHSSTPINTTTSQVYVFLGVSANIVPQVSGQVFCSGRMSYASVNTANLAVNLGAVAFSGNYNPAGGQAISVYTTNTPVFLSAAPSTAANAQTSIFGITLFSGLTLGVTSTVALTVEINAAGTGTWTLPTVSDIIAYEI